MSRKESKEPPGMQERPARGPCRMGVSARIRAMLLVRYPPPRKQWLGRAKAPPRRVRRGTSFPGPAPGNSAQPRAAPGSPKEEASSCSGWVTRRRSSPGLVPSVSRLQAAQGGLRSSHSGPNCPRNGPNLLVSKRDPSPLLCSEESRPEMSGPGAGIT